MLKESGLTAFFLFFCRARTISKSSIQTLSSHAFSQPVNLRQQHGSGHISLKQPSFFCYPARFRVAVTLLKFFTTWQAGRQHHNIIHVAGRTETICQDQQKLIFHLVQHFLRGVKDDVFVLALTGNTVQRFANPSIFLLLQLREQ